jgi:hypothetical protein
MMPSQSKKQHNLMALVANNPSAAKRLKVPQSVGEDFMKADVGKKFKEGGASMKSNLKQNKKVVKKAMSMHDKQAHGGKKTDLTKLKHGGMMSKGAMMGKGYAEGGMIANSMGKVTSGGKRPHGEHTVQAKGHTKGKMVKMNKSGKAC